jgi:hypothetical protein
VRRPQLWPAEVHGEWSSDVQIDATYPVGYQYEIVMDEGAITVPRILFRGRLSVHVTSFPHVRLVEYADALNSSRIASSVSADFSVGQHELTVTFQRVTIGGVHNLAIRVEKAATVENES